MNFALIVPHLSRRGFVTRELWKGQAIVFFGMDNSAHKSIFEGLTVSWSPNLSEIKADDWIILPYYWETGADDHKPFLLKDNILKSYRIEEEEKRLEENKNDEQICYSHRKT